MGPDFKFIPFSSRPGVGLTVVPGSTTGAAASPARTEDNSGWQRRGFLPYPHADGRRSPEVSTRRSVGVLFPATPVAAGPDGVVTGYGRAAELLSALSARPGDRSRHRFPAPGRLPPAP